MNTEQSSELKRIDREIRKINLLSAPGPVILGFGFYGLFKTSTDTILAALNNRHLVYAMLTVGAFIEIWQLRRLLPLYKQRVKLLRNEQN